MNSVHGSIFRKLPLSFRPAHIGRFLVRERDDDYEAEHYKSDHISIKSIKPFSIEVDTH
jgi:hypothetical protein